MQATVVELFPDLLQEEESATAEAREIYRSQLERALEDELLACRRQLEQKHRDCQAEIEASSQQREHVNLLHSKLQNAHVASEHMRRKMENLAFDFHETEQARSWMSQRLEKSTQSLNMTTQQNLTLKVWGRFTVSIQKIYISICIYVYTDPSAHSKHTHTLSLSHTHTLSLSHTHTHT